MNEAERQARLNISPEVLREMERACPTSAMRDIVSRRIVHSQSQSGVIPTSQQLSGVRTGGGAAPINTSGWQTPKALGPQPHISHVDRLIDAQDRRDKAELIARDEAMRRALGKRCPNRDD